MAAGQKLAITGVQVVDTFAATHAGALALNVSSTGGAIAMTDAGKTLAGSDTSSFFVQGTFAQINADLATLSYTAGATAVPGQISLQVYDQLGLSATTELPVSITGGRAASCADHHRHRRRRQHRRHGRPHYDQLGRRERQHLSIGHRRRGHHRQRRQHGDGFRRWQHHHHGVWQRRHSHRWLRQRRQRGSGGQYDFRRGTGNTFALPKSGGTYNLFGYVLQNSDLLDLRPLLAATSWNGAQATLANFLNTTASPDGANTMLVVTPTGAATGASYTAATFNGSGTVSLTTLLSHSLT